MPVCLINNLTQILCHGVCSHELLPNGSTDIYDYFALDRHENWMGNKFQMIRVTLSKKYFSIFIYELCNCFYIYKFILKMSFSYHFLMAILVILQIIYFAEQCFPGHLLMKLEFKTKYIS